MLNDYLLPWYLRKNIMTNSGTNLVQTLKSGGLRWAGRVVRIIEDRTLFRTLMCNLSVKRPVDRARRWSVDNIGSDAKNGTSLT